MYKVSISGEKGKKEVKNNTSLIAIEPTTSGLTDPTNKKSSKMYVGKANTFFFCFFFAKLFKKK